MFHAGLPLGRGDCYSLYEQDLRLFLNRKQKDINQKSFKVG